MATHGESPLLADLKEIEDLLTLPHVPEHLAKAKALALSIARRAPVGPTANLAMQLLSALEELGRQVSAARLDRVKEVLARVKIPLGG
jgi:hypothetical protein